MFTYTALAEAVTNAKTIVQIDTTNRLIWSAHGHGLVSDEEAQKAAETLEDRKKAIRLRQTQKGQSRAISANSRNHRNPDRIKRRRSWAYGNAVPSTVAIHYTPAELAALSALITILRKSNTAQMTVKEIADISGTSERTVRYMLAIAIKQDHLKVERRRVAAFKNLPNRFFLGDDPVLRLWVKTKGSMLQKQSALIKHIVIPNISNETIATEGVILRNITSKAKFNVNLVPKMGNKML